jgi:RNA polymerase sigma factor (sigma-70 family)
MEIRLDSLMINAFQPRTGHHMDRAELERELERLHAACWGWALACCSRDREAAEETLQSAYLRILSGTARFDGRSAVRTWVFGVIRNTAREELRGRALRMARESGAEAEAEALPDGAPGADLLAERDERRLALVDALGNLSPRQREVLQLVFYHDMTIEEASEVMQISLGSARTHYDRGKKAMLLALGPDAARDREAAP